MLAKLVEASKIIDALFLRQVWSGNEAMLLDLVKDQTAAGRARLHYFLINKGPWSRLDHDQTFVPGAPAKPAGANFYPADASKADLERWMQSLPEADRARATGFFSVIRRGPGGAFTIVPYNVEYQNELTRAAGLLREAAALSSEPTLEAFLAKRADAFLSNDYYESDVAWMEIKGAIEPTIGPYEVYEDEYFNYKAGFESFITVQDESESGKLARFGGELQDIENHLPIDPVLPQSQARRARADRGRQRDLCGRRREPRRPDGGVQPAERRAGDAREGRQARHAQERAGREVREDAPADLEGRAVAGRSEGRGVRRVLHAHPRARADARARAAQHHRQRPPDHRPAGDEGSVQRARGSESRHLVALCDPVHDRQGRAAESARAARSTRHFWPPRFARSASASMKRTAAASPSS